MAGFVAVPKEAIGIVGRDPTLLGAVLLLYSKAWDLDYKAFPAADSWLAGVLGIPKTGARKLVLELAEIGLVEIVSPGDRHTARTIRVLRPKGSGDAAVGSTATGTATSTKSDVVPDQNPNPEARPQSPSEVNDPPNHQPSTSATDPDPVGSVVLRLVFDRWIVLWRRFVPGTTKRKWTAREAGMIRARLSSGEYSVQDLLAMIAWTKDGTDDYAKVLRGEPCKFNKGVASEEHVGPDTLFKPEKFELRVSKARAYVTSVGGMHVIESLDELDRISQAEEAGGDTANGDEGAPGTPEAGAQERATADGAEGGSGSGDVGNGVDDGPAARGAHLRLVEGHVAGTG